VPKATTNLTKILATIGPASDSPDDIDSLIKNGVRAFRLNFSHGSMDEHAARLNAVREAGKRCGVAVGVLGDLRGPKLRLRDMQDGPIDLVKGDQVVFVSDEVPGHRRDDQTVVLSVTYPPFVEEVDVGHRVLIDDGLVRLLVIEKQRKDGKVHSLSCRVMDPGKVQANKGVNLPDSMLSVPSLTDFDRTCVAWALEHQVDFLALSFVRSAGDVQLLRDVIHELDPNSDTDAQPIPIVAKLETPQSISDLDAIITKSDMVMVARGDLGVEMDLAQVPVLQKRIIKASHDQGKPAIVATQMLQSMIVESSPTRAEISDVANAILDGADAVMLSGETAVGKYPDRAVYMMAHTAEVTEAYAAETHDGASQAPIRLRESKYRTAALAHGVSVIVDDIHAKAVVMWSELGGGARYLSQNRLSIPIIAVSSNHQALARMSLLFGVVPVHMDCPDDPEVFVEFVDRLMQEKRWCEVGDPIVIAKGEPLGQPGVTNKIRLHYIGDKIKLR